MGEKFKWMEKGLILAVVMLIGLWFQPMDARAELYDIAYLRVAGKVMVEHGVVLQTEVDDGKGGKAIYKEETNTLILDNFHYMEGHGTKYYIYGYDMSRYQRFHVVLVGTNDLRREDRIPEGTTIDNAAISLDDDVIVEGTGKLITNTRVSITKAEFKDCTVEIDSLYYGIYGGYGLILDNADITINIDKFCFHAAGLYLDGCTMEIRDSSLKVQTSSGVFNNSIMVSMVNDNANYLYESDQWIKFGDDITVTDKEGNPLNICGLSCWDNCYFCFSKDGTKETYLDNDALLSSSVYIISAKKAAMTEKIQKVQAIIDAIGTVEITSEEKIKAAREAYDSLSEFGDKADYARGQVANYSTLTQAEATHAALVQAEEEKKAAEEAAKLEAEKEAQRQQEQNQSEGNITQENESQTGSSQGTENGSQTENSQGAQNGSQNEGTLKDKIITIKKKKYTIKTPKLKSAKSKKKKTVTVSFTTSKKNSGYQISYARNKKFKKAKKVTLKGTKRNTITIKKLKSGKTYYIRIRGYRKINGKTYYGNWSNVKKVRVK